MNESTFWGGVGVLLAVAAVGVMALDPAVGEALAGGNLADPVLWYTLGVALVALVTVAVVGLRLR